MSSNDLTLQGYKIQGIFYLNKRTHRIQQNIGGACPLLALSNTLFLNHQIHYNKGGRRIKFQELTDCLTQHLENMLNTDSKTGKVKTELRVDKNMNNLSNKLYEDSHDDSDDHDIDISIDNIDADESHSLPSHTDDIKDKENMSINNIDNNNQHQDSEEKAMDLKIKQIEECVSLFPKLEEGLDINIKFSDACDFEENPGYRMFSHYGFKLFHGWVVNPNDENETELYELIGNKSYDETIDYLISDPDKDSSEEEKKELELNKEIIRKFFRESATQLTSYGLERLYKLMDSTGEDILAIFFRNNHFSTIVKHGDILYEFVTDEGIVDADPQITWQTLSQISGDEEFVNNKFQPIHTNISQYTQIAQYNRMKNMADNGDGQDEKDGEFNNNNGGGGGDGLGGLDDDENNNNDPLINILENALRFIDSNSFEKLMKERDEMENIDPLISHGLTQRINDTFDIYLCKDYIYGINNITQMIDNKKVMIRMFRLCDALSIYKNINIAIDWMHNDNKYAIILELLDENNQNNQLNNVMNNMFEEEDNKIMEKDINEIGVTKIKMNQNIIIGCIIYEWMKFNFWDWRETDWEDYDIDSVYNVNNMTNHRYNKQKLLRDSGVRTDYFIRVENLCINNKYNCDNDENENINLSQILLQSLLYAYPSGSKFGVLIPTINTSQVKCFTNSGFTITRLEQSYGTDSKYKMTTQSIFTLNKYQSWLYNSNIIQSKVKTITSKTNTGPAAIHTNITDIIIQQQSPLIDHDDDNTTDYSNIPPLIDENNMHVTTTHNRHIGISDDDDDNREHYEDDDDDDDDDDDESNNGMGGLDDMDDDMGHDDGHCDGIGIDSQQQQQEQLSGQTIDNNNNILMSSGISGVSGLFGYHSGHQSINNNNMGGDNFVCQVLSQLNLMRYNHTFMEFNINKDALIHLDPSVVEFMINDETDRNNFLQWLNQYKNKNTNKPTKPPQESNTNVKTHKTNTNTDTDTNTNTDTDQLK